MTEEIRDALKRAADVPLRPEDYEQIARTAEVRRVRRRIGRAAAAFVAVAAVVGLSMVLLRPSPASDGPDVADRPVGSGVPSAGSSNALRLQGHRVADTTRFSLTFIDGSAAELIVPSATSLEGMGIRPSGGARIPGVADRDFVVPAGGMRWFATIGAKGRELTRTGDKTVSLWSVTAANGGPTRYLVFDFGQWVIGVWDGAGGSTMSDAELQTWADSLDGRTTQGGFLVLTARRPLELLGPGTGASPSLTWGGDGNDGLTIRLEPCASDINDASGSDAERLVTLCRPDWGAHVELHGTSNFVDALTDKLSVRRGS